MRLLMDVQRPLQLIFAGKAHPHDLAGKEIIRRLVHFAGDPRVRSRVLFLEDYDMTIARYLVSGSDVWLNTPRRPLEASGTSGMKAALNGVLNVSILDGWWDEAHDSRMGWAIGRGEQYEDAKLQDGIEGTALYDLLEREVLPLFYSRGVDGLPREWIRCMKASMREVGAGYSSHRMLLEYAGRYYLPGLAAEARLAGEGYAGAKDLAGYLERVRRAWPNVRIEDFTSSSPSILKVGDTIAVQAKVSLAGLASEDVCVELYHGPVSSQGEIREPRRLEMPARGTAGAATVYGVDAPADATGRQGFTVRVLPRHPSLVHPFLPGLVRWG
jgi:starch phosphorylase